MFAGRTALPTSRTRGYSRRHPVVGTCPVGHSADMSRRTKGLLGASLGGLFVVVSIVVGRFDSWKFEGPSMSPTILSQERVLSEPVSIDELRRGDIVVVESPADEVMIIKRIVGMPGETIGFEGAQLRINGWVLPTTELGPCINQSRMDPRCRLYRWEVDGRSWDVAMSRTPMPPEERTVPAGAYYVLGDRLDQSNDSRNPQMGAIPADRIRGRVFYRYWARSESGLNMDRMFQRLDQ